MGGIDEASQFSDPELVEMFSNLSSETPPEAPEAPPVGAPAEPEPAAPPAEGTPAPVPAEAPAPEGAPTPDPAQTPPQAPETPETGAQEPLPADPAAPPAPEITPPAFQSIEEAQEWAVKQEQRRRELESFYGRKLAEAQQGGQATQQQLLAMQQQMAAITQRVMEPPAPPAPNVTAEDIAQSVRMRPDDTVFWLADNVPDAVGYALAQVQEQHGSHEAYRIQQDLNEAARRRDQQIAQQRAVEAEAPKIIRQGFQRVVEDVRDDVGPEQFDAVSARVGKLCEENLAELQDPRRSPEGVTPASVQRYVMRQYLAAQREAAARSAAQLQQPRALTPAETPPVGGAGPVAIPSSGTDGDELVDEMAAFQQSRRMDFG